MTDRIGLDAVLNTRDFQRGMNVYLGGLKRMEMRTGEAALHMTAKMGGMATAATAALTAVAAALAAVTVAAGGAAVAVGKFALDAVNNAISVESAFAGVVKTTDGLVDETGELTEAGAKLRREFRDLSKEIPTRPEELMAVGELAGQLGIASENLIEYTRTVADLGETTDLTLEAAAMGFAQIMAVMGTAQTQIDNMGSAVVALGNNYATTESKILAMSQNMAAATALAHVHESALFGIAAATSTVGMEAEAGGSAVQRVFLDINKAVTQNTDEARDALELFARTSGLSAEEFRRLWAEDAAEAFTLFVEGLGDSGSEAQRILDALGLADVRVTRTLLALAGAHGLLREAIETSSRAYEENLALTREAELRYQTFEAQLEIMRNRMAYLRQELGLALLPALNDLLQSLGPLAYGLGSIGEDVLENILAPALQRVAEWAKEVADRFATYFPEGVQPSEDIVQNLARFISAIADTDLSETIEELDKVRDAAGRVANTLAWILELNALMSEMTPIELGKLAAQLADATPEEMVAILEERLAGYHRILEALRASLGLLPPEVDQAERDITDTVEEHAKLRIDIVSAETQNMIDAYAWTFGTLNEIVYEGTRAITRYSAYAADRITKDVRAMMAQVFAAVEAYTSLAGMIGGLALTPGAFVQVRRQMEAIEQGFANVSAALQDYKDDIFAAGVETKKWRLDLEDILSRLEGTGEAAEEAGEKAKAAAEEVIDPLQELKDLLEAGRTFADIGDRFAEAFEAWTLDPLKEAVQDIEDLLDHMADVQREADEAVQEAWMERIRERYDEQRDAERDMYDEQRDRMRDAFDVQEDLARETYDTLRDMIRETYDAQRDEVRETYDEERDAIRDLEEQRTRAARREHDEAEQALSDELDTRREQIKLQARLGLISGQAAQEALHALELEEREREQGLEDDLQATLDAIDAQTDAELDAMAARRDAELEAIETKEDAELDAAKAQHEAILDNIADQLDAALDSLEAQHEARMAYLEEERDAALEVAEAWTSGADVMYRAGLVGRLNTLLEQQAEQQEKLLALEEARLRLGFLEAQTELLDLIIREGLEASDILGGLALGIDADVGELVEAMTRAVQAIVEAAQTELGIASPSSVMAKEVGTPMLEGLMAGLSGEYVTPPAKISHITTVNRNVTRSIVNNLSMGGQTINTPVDLENFADYIVQRVNERLS